MWMALFGPLPKPAWFGNAARLLYIGGVRLAGAVLGNVFLWSHTIFYPVLHRPGLDVTGSRRRPTRTLPGRS